MSALVARIRALPRVMIIVLAALVALGFYFLVFERLLDLNGHYSSQADTLAKQLATEAANRKTIEDSARPIEQAVGIIGQPEMPRSPSSASAALEQRIADIFAQHRVSNQRTIQHPLKAFPRIDPKSAPPVALTGPNQKLDLLVFELSFETDLPTLTAILEELEASPEVSAVSRLNLRRSGGRRSSGGGGGNDDGVLAVALNVETWALSPTTAKPASTKTDEEPSL